ncbi:MAG: glycoside hydrolase family 88 protein [Firmicutes bacterium]|nr:glycoside hydrolase family 88 protein [Bacillota bacterium]
MSTTIPRSPALWKELARQFMDASAVDWQWHYEAGCLLKALVDAARWTGESAWLHLAEDIMDRLVLPDGTIDGYRLSDYNLDNINPGKVLFDVYASTGAIKFCRAIDHLMRQIALQPCTMSGGWWHKLIYPRQMWLDGIYMASPFVVRYARRFDELHWLDVVVHQIALIASKTKQPDTGLFVHGWDESRTEAWAHPQTGQSPHVWGRGMGWFLMALADILEDWPPSSPGKDVLHQVFSEAARAVLSVQDEATGLWHQVLTHPDHPDNYLEASASAMFVYALAKGARLGLLDASCRAGAQRGYQGLITHLLTRDDHGTLHLIQCNAVAGLGGTPYRDGSLAYYLRAPVVQDDPKAVSAFIMASLEVDNDQQPLT